MSCIYLASQRLELEKIPLQRVNVLYIASHGAASHHIAAYYVTSHSCSAFGLKLDKWMLL